MGSGVARGGGQGGRGGWGSALNPTRGSRPQTPSCTGFGVEPQLPAYMIQSSQPVWSAVESSNLSESSLGGGVGCGDTRSEPDRSDGERGEAEDRSTPSQT